jgi:hypothetical protein
VNGSASNSRKKNALYKGGEGNHENVYTEYIASAEPAQIPYVLNVNVYIIYNSGRVVKEF